jgi:hypothetical protein
VVNNVSYGGRWFDLYDNLSLELVEMTNNVIADSVLMLHRTSEGTVTYSIDDPDARAKFEEMGNVVVEVNPGFIDIEHGNYDLAEDSPAWELGFKPIPFDSIGLQIDEWRETAQSPFSK